MSEDRKGSHFIVCEYRIAERIACVYVRVINVMKNNPLSIGNGCLLRGLDWFQLNAIFYFNILHFRTHCVSRTDIVFVKVIQMTKHILWTEQIVSPHHIEWRCRGTGELLVLLQQYKALAVVNRL